MNGSTASGAEETPRTSVKRRAKDAAQEASFAYHAKMVTYLLAWSLVSGLIIILNNWVMHYDGFPFPIALSATGPLFSWVVSAVLVASGHTRLERHMTFKTWMKQVFPIGFFTAVTYATGNELYLYMSVSFIQMMKSMSPIVVLFLLVAFKLDVLTTPKLVGVATMSAGMLVACHAEPSFSVFGLALMVVGEASEAMRMVFFQQLLGVAQFGLIEGLFYTCPANFFFLCVGVAVFEEGEIKKPENYERVLRNPGPYLCISALGFLVILTTLGVIQTCGSLTFKAAGQVRNIGIIIVSMAVFGDRVTVTQAVGYAINVVGFCVYQVVKTREDLHNLREEFKREALDGDEGVRIAAGGEDATAKTPLLDRAGSPLGGDNRGRGVSSGV
jgi:drug/metabolite transporter (DMT)-like permease